MSLMVFLRRYRVHLWSVAVVYCLLLVSLQYVQTRRLRAYAHAALPNLVDIEVAHHSRNYIGGTFLII